MTARVAVVTGAARGIGSAIATRLAADGCDVAILDLDQSACIETVDSVKAIGRKALAVGVNVTDEQGVDKAVQQIETELGQPAILVNNAGILRNKTLTNLSMEDWQSVLDVHLNGAFLMTRACLEPMKAAGWGRVINISSIAALGFRGQANYSAAKAGLLGLTKTVALEAGRYGVTVNAVAPGFTVTEMTRSIAQRDGIDFGVMVDEMVKTIPVGRAGNPEDIAHAVAYFADERSGFVSGQVLYVAGGPAD